MIYRYVGSAEVLAAPMQTDRCQVTSPGTLSAWLDATFGKSRPEEITLTYVILEASGLWVAERHSEHVACARRAPVLGAGELTVCGESVVEISNLSTGYCPEPESWDAVSSALDAAGLARPADFTASFRFRRCPACRERQIIRDDEFRCVFCDATLPDRPNLQPDLG